MRNRNFIAASLLAIAALPSSAFPQASVASAPAPQNQAIVKTGAPIRILRKAPNDARLFSGEVIAATNSAITVRSKDNERMIRTFTYSDALREKVQPMRAAGGLQPGDKVKVHYHQMDNSAYSIDAKVPPHR